MNVREYRVRSKFSRLYSSTGDVHKHQLAPITTKLNAFQWATDKRERQLINPADCTPV